MSILSVFQDTAPEQPLKVLTHLEDIAPTLAEVGVHIERWEASAPIGSDAGPQDILAAYNPQIERLKQARGYAAVDFLDQRGERPQKSECSKAQEHRYAEDQARLFVVGRALLCLHIDDKVYAVACEKNDFIVVPAGMRQWLDIGENPHLVSIGLSHDPDALAEPTGDDIALRFPRLDD